MRCVHPAVSPNKRTLAINEVIIFSSIILILNLNLNLIISQSQSIRPIFCLSVHHMYKPPLHTKHIYNSEFSQVKPKSHRPYP